MLNCHGCLMLNSFTMPQGIYVQITLVAEADNIILNNIPTTFCVGLLCICIALGINILFSFGYLTSYRQILVYLAAMQCLLIINACWPQGRLSEIRAAHISHPCHRIVRFTAPQSWFITFYCSDFRVPNCSIISSRCYIKVEAPVCIMKTAAFCLALGGFLHLVYMLLVAPERYRITFQALTSISLAYPLGQTPAWEFPVGLQVATQSSRLCQHLKLSIH